MFSSGYGVVLQDVGLGAVAQSLTTAVVLPLAGALWPGRFSRLARRIAKVFAACCYAMNMFD